MKGHYWTDKDIFSQYQPTVEVFANRYVEPDEVHTALVEQLIKGCSSYPYKLIGYVHDSLLLSGFTTVFVFEGEDQCVYELNPLTSYLHKRAGNTKSYFNGEWSIDLAPVFIDFPLSTEKIHSNMIKHIGKKDHTLQICTKSYTQSNVSGPLQGDDTTYLMYYPKGLCANIMVKLINDFAQNKISQNLTFVAIAAEQFIEDGFERYNIVFFDQFTQKTCILDLTTKNFYVVGTTFKTYPPNWRSRPLWNFACKVPALNNVVCETARSFVELYKLTNRQFTKPRNNTNMKNILFMMEGNNINVSRKMVQDFEGQYVHMYPKGTFVFLDGKHKKLEHLVKNVKEYDEKLFLFGVTLYRNAPKFVFANKDQVLEIDLTYNNVYYYNASIYDYLYEKPSRRDYDSRIMDTLANTLIKIAVHSINEILPVISSPLYNRFKPL
ncbi:heme-binding protein-like protein [Ranid herpesvirus 3]|uniref:Heme-binding protein-like protein n=1 Tax=Ranid herpesvirus 3 TaxID=1987509 RepID=A0A1X9T5K7_9VIRU|nr:heme-binding protein-like protein [Ranid herpesvirus 3]ARR28988.1 heme-binding protein-like protein [Ranid herpesvirus 3]